MDNNAIYGDVVGVSAPVVAGVVRYTEQNLSEFQKEQARNNIGAADKQTVAAIKDFVDKETGDIEDATNAIIVIQESFFADTTDLITTYPIISDSSIVPDGVKCNLTSDGTLVIDIDGQKVKDALGLPIAFVSLPKGNYRFVCLTSIIIDDDYTESNEWGHNLKICNPATMADFSFIELEKKTTMGKYRYASFGSSTQFPCMLYYSYHSDDVTSENVPNNITIELRPKIYRI